MTMLHDIWKNKFAAPWEVLPHAAYSLDLAPSNCYLFASKGEALTEQHFSLYEDIKKWFDKWFVAKRKIFTGIHKLSERWKKCITSAEAFFE
jgi:hypothetical protein